MPNAKDLRGAGVNHLSFLFVGHPGSGKSTLYRTLPGRGFLYIFDPNCLASLEGMDVEYEIFSPDLLDINVHPLAAKTRDGKDISPDRVVKAKEPRAYVEFERMFEDHLETGFLEEFSWVGTDSFTTFSDAVMDRVMWLNGRFGKQPEQDDWSAQMMTIQMVARSITHRNKMYVATAHEEFVKDKTTAVISVQPWLTGKLKVRLPLLFSNIYRCVSDDGHYYIQTTPHKMYKYMRSSIKGLEDEIEVTIPFDKVKQDFVNPQSHGIGKLLREAGYIDAPVPVEKVVDITRKKK